MDKHQESVPVNTLEGTSHFREDITPVTASDMARTIATAFILLLKTMVRHSAGRVSFKDDEQRMMFMALFNGNNLQDT
ncbi:hypothetical protein V7S43_008495 [Phytophthora oleae]|uniref:Biotin and thiamin synthesis-associated domain-containing protein n=1 Tax=Phytophthora oleae TaxID=2107226 RepID=A0ABD3FMK6_9STRA